MSRKAVIEKLRGNNHDRKGRKTSKNNDNDVPYNVKEEDYKSIDIEDEDDFRELYHRLLPIINNLRRYSEENMTFSIDDEADSLIQNVLLKIGEDGLVYKLKELSKQEYFIE